MKYRTICLCTLTALLFTSPCEAQGNESSLIKVSISQPAPAYLLGGPVLIGYRYQAIKRGWDVLMDFHGVPGDLRFEMHDRLGRPVAFKRGVVLGDHMATFLSAYFTTANETLRLRADLNEVFEIVKPDKYSVSVWRHKERLAETSVNIVAFQGDKAVVTRGKCSQIGSDLASEELGRTIPVECELRTGVASAENSSEPYTFIRIDWRICYGDKIVPGEKPIVQLVRPNTRVGKAELDYRWQLWTILESDAERALMVWDVRRGEVRTLAKWGKRELTLGSTRARRDTSAKIVFGGVAGEPKFSTIDSE